MKDLQFAKEKVFMEVKHRLVASCVAMLLLVAFEIAALVRILTNGRSSGIPQIVLYAAACVLVIIIAFFFLRFVLPDVLDLISARKDRFIITKVIVVGFKYSKDEDDVYIEPVVLDEKSNKKITLDSKDNYSANARYVICYLPKTKVGTIVRRIYDEDQKD